MSLARPLVHFGLKKLFVNWKKAVGVDMAAKTRVSVVGGLYLQAREIRPTHDVDIVVKSGTGIDRFKIRNSIARLDKRFTVNSEGKCGLTYRDKPEDEVVCYDIIDETVMLYMPEGMLLNEVVEQDATPLPTDSEAIALKLFAGSDHLKSRSDKAVQDFDDAMMLLNELYKDGGEISYKNAVEKTAMEIAFNAFYPEYEHVKKDRNEVHWTKAEWNAFLKID